MVGLAGFEPAHDRIKTYCLTAWLQPIHIYDNIIFFKKQQKNINLNSLLIYNYYFTTLSANINNFL